MTSSVSHPDVLRTSESPLPIWSAVSDRVAFLDREGNILAVNKPWLELARQTQTPLNSVGPGANYLEVCRRSSIDSSDAQEALDGLCALLDGTLESFAMDYTAQLHSRLSYFRMTASLMAYRDVRIIVSHADIVRGAELSRYAVHVRDKERERIAREIHDDIGPRIALLSLTARGAVTQGAVEMLADLGTAIRNLSHGLHPPLLRYSGVCVAIKSLCDEFAKIHRIAIEMVVRRDPPRLADEVELCIFRICQESLQNIAKHSGAERATVALEYTQREVRLSVVDRGRGFVRSAIRHPGLGLLSMEERALSIKGRLEVRSAVGEGTEVHLTIPLPD